MYVSLKTFISFSSETLMLVHGNNVRLEHTASVASRMPHLPITAMTKVAEMGGPDSPHSVIGFKIPPGTEAPPPASQSESLSQPGGHDISVTRFCPVTSLPTISLTLRIDFLLVSSMKAWTPAPIRTLGSPRLHGESGCQTIII